MITALISFAVGFLTGLAVFRNNAGKAAAIEAKAKSIADEFAKK